MAQQVISQEQKEKHEALRGLLTASLALAENCSDTEASQIIKDRLSQMESAALLVFVGEVKSGKSSFVNALLGEDVCEVAPDPCTSGIQELVYGEERETQVLGQDWERVTLPMEVLREISIVDTPGTNSIIRNHQAITERYIPRSDLVVFVFPAKNPHTGTSWDFLSLIRKEWHRKTVFILQQSDLTSPRELEINRERVQQYARERNVQNPVVFAVSAKLETEGKPGSGYPEFRRYLSNAVQTGEVWQMKVNGARDTAVKIAERILKTLQGSLAELEDDRSFYTGLLEKLASRKEKANSLRKMAVDSMSISYNRLAGRLEQDFTEGLRAGTIIRRTIPFLRDKDVKTWLKDLQSNFEMSAKKEIEAESSRVSKDISEEMMVMFSELTEAIDHRQQAVSGKVKINNPDRADILASLQQQLTDLRISDIADHKGIEGTDVGRLSLAGGGLTAVGAVIAIASNLMIFDITGGILAVTGAALIAVTLTWKRSGILRDFSGKMRQSKEEFRHRLDTEISRMFDKLFMEIEHRLNEPLARIHEKREHLIPLVNQAKHVQQQAEDLRK
jgi:ribosome biogenesis GTPase A